MRRQDPSQEAPLAKKPRPADSAGDKDDDDDEDVVVEKRGAPYSGASGDAKTATTTRGEREIADGDDFERRRKRGGASGATNKTKHESRERGRRGGRDGERAARRGSREDGGEVAVLHPEQMDLQWRYRRSSLPKTALRRVFQAVTGTILNPNGLIVLAAVGKLFVGSLRARAEIAFDDEGVSDLDEIKPAVRERTGGWSRAGTCSARRKTPLQKQAREMCENVFRCRHEACTRVVG